MVRILGLVRSLNLKLEHSQLECLLVVDLEAFADLSIPLVVAGILEEHIATLAVVAIQPTALD